METYAVERKMQLNMLGAELVYMETQIKCAKDSGDSTEYNRFMKLYVTVQKEYMRLCREAEQDAAETDPLTEFNSVYDKRGILAV